MNKIKLKQIEEITAENVVLSEELQITDPVGAITNKSKDSRGRTISTNGYYGIPSGTTIKDVLDTMFSDEKQPKIAVNPNINDSEMQLEGEDCPWSVEAGEMVHHLDFVLRFNPGEYSTKNPSPTGVVLGKDAEATIKINNNVVAEGVPCRLDKTIGIDFSEVALLTSAVVDVKFSYSEGYIAKTNKGNPFNPTVQIPARTGVIKTFTLANIYRAYFYGTSPTKESANIDSYFIRSLTNSGKKVDKGDISTILHPTATDKMVLVAFKVENGVTNASMGLLDAAGRQYATLPISRTLTVNVNDSQGANPVQYKVCIADASFQGNENVRITLI